MPSVVDFKDLGGRADEAEKRREEGRNRTKTNYVKLDKSVKIRPIGQVVELHKFFVKRKDGSSRTVCVKPEDVDEAARILSENAGYEVTPNNRFAINVIDREDQQIKVLENGITIFGTFGQWSNSTGIHPGGKDGYDWDIKVKGSGFQRKYTAIATKPSPLTADEKTRIREKNEIYCLEEIYKETPLDKLVERVFGEGNSGSSGPEPNSEPQGDPTDSGDDDDLFKF